MNLWLESPGTESSAFDLQRVVAAVGVLPKTYPTRKELAPLCSSFNVRQNVHGSCRRPIATVSKELQQAVIIECNMLRCRFDCETIASPRLHSLAHPPSGNDASTAMLRPLPHRRHHRLPMPHSPPPVPHRAMLHSLRVHRSLPKLAAMLSSLLA